MSSSESKPLSTSPSQLSSTLSSLAAVPPQPQKEPPRPPPLQQGGQGKTGAARKPKKKRSPEEREQRRKRLAEKEKAIASLEEKIRNLKLEIEKSKAELSDTTRKASIVCQATQTVDPGHVMRMREVFSSNATAEQAPKPERAYQYDKAGTIPEAQASGLPEVSRPVPKILRAAPLPPNYEAPPPPVPLVGPQKHRPVSKAFSTMINDKNKVTITFINPEPYSKKRPCK